MKNNKKIINEKIFLNDSVDELKLYQDLYKKVMSEMHTLQDLIDGKTLVCVEGDSGKDIFRAKQLGLFTCNVKGVDIIAKCESDAAPLIHYIEQGGVYGSEDFSRLLGYDENQIARYRKLLLLQDKLGLPPFGYRKKQIKLESYNRMMQLAGLIRG